MGLDWFHATNAGIYPAANRIEFNDSIIIKENDRWIKRNKKNLEIENDEFLELNIISINEDDEDYTPDTDWNLKDRKIDVKLQYKFRNSVEKQVWKDLEEEIYKVSAKTLFELSECTIRKHKINLNEERIINKRCFRMSEKERTIFKEEIKAMLSAGIITKSNSEYSSPAFLIPKKDGTYRMVIDYREINAITRTINFPLPNPTEIFDRLAGSSIFSTLDLKAGYWQIAMEEDSKKYTAFSTPDGHYEFSRLPFGLKNAPAEFSFIMNQIFGDISFVEVYLDDITIHSKTFAKHCEHIALVLKRIKRSGLRLNPEKCNWMAHEIKLLGHIVSKETIKMDQKKIEAIIFLTKQPLGGWKHEDFRQNTQLELEEYGKRALEHVYRKQITFISLKVFTYMYNLSIIILVCLFINVYFSIPLIKQRLLNDEGILHMQICWSLLKKQ